MYTVAILYLVIAAIWAGVIHFGIQHTAKSLCAGVFATGAAFIVTIATIVEKNPFDFGEGWIKWLWVLTALFAILTLVLSKPGLYLSFAWCIWIALCTPVVEISILTQTINVAYAAYYSVAMIPAIILTWKFRAYAKIWTIGGIGGAIIFSCSFYALLVLVIEWFSYDIAKLMSSTDADIIAYIIKLSPIALLGSGAFFGIRYANKRSKLIAATKPSA